MRKFWLLLLCGLLLGSGAQAGIRVKNLYDVDIPVENQSWKVRSATLRLALVQILVRLSGNDNIAINQDIARALSRASRYITRYRYSKRKDVAEGQPPLMFHVTFDRSRLEKLLRDTGQPIWGQRRPSALVWLAVDDGQKRFLLRGVSGEDVRRMVERHGHRRGVPLLFPLMDLEDQRKISFATVWGGFMDEIRLASARYTPDAILVGRLYKDSQGQWSARWLLYNLNRISSWSNAGADLDQVIAIGLNGTGQVLASRYASQSSGSSQQNIFLRVRGIDKVASYAKLSKYLESLSIIKAVNVESVTKDEIRFSLQVNGGEALLVQQFALSNIIAPEAVTVAPSGPVPGQSPDVAAGAPELRYQLVP